MQTIKTKLKYAHSTIVDNNSKQQKRGIVLTEYQIIFLKKVFAHRWKMVTERNR